MKSKLEKNLFIEEQIFNSGLLPNPNKILNKYGRNYQVLRDILNDAHVWSAVQSRKGGLLSMDFQIIHSENLSNNKLIDRFISSNDNSKLFNDILDAIYFGFSIIEIIWEEADNSILPKQLLTKPQEWFSFDANSNLYFVRGNRKTKINNNKVLLSKSEASFSNPYGTPLLSKIYWPLKFKNAGLKYWVRYMEKFGLPSILGQYRRGAKADEIEKLLDTLTNMNEDSVIVAPEDIEIKINESKSNSSAELYKELISFCNNEISKAILSQNLTTEVNKGSYAASKTHYQIRRELIEADKRLVENSMNNLFKKIIDLNSNNNDYPKFEFMQIDADSESRLQRDRILSQHTNINFNKKYWSKHYGLDEDEFEISQDK